MVTAIVDFFPSVQKGNRRPFFVLLICCALFLAGLPMTCHVSFYVTSRLSYVSICNTSHSQHSASKTFLPAWPFFQSVSKKKKTSQQGLPCKSSRMPVAVWLYFQVEVHILLKVRLNMSRFNTFWRVVAERSCAPDSSSAVLISRVYKLKDT